MRPKESEDKYSQTCNWCLQMSQSALCCQSSPHDLNLAARRVRRSWERSNVQLLRGRCTTQKKNRRCNDDTLGSFYRSAASAGHRGLKCFYVHISGGEAGKVRLHRFKTAAALLANNGVRNDKTPNSGTGKLPPPLFTGNNSVKTRRVIISNVQISARDYKLHFRLW